MNSMWKKILLSQQANIENRDSIESVTSFGNEIEERKAALNDTVIADLSHYGLLKASGADAQAFLHNQLTNDLRQINAQSSQLSAYCTPKGRALGLFRIFMRNDAYYLSMPAGILEGVRKRLGMFILMSKVTLEETGDDLLCLGLSGPQAPALVEQLIGKCPADADQVEGDGQLTVIRVAGLQPRFQIYGPLEAMEKAWQQLSGTARPVGRAAWQLLEIEAGIPAVYPQTVEAFVPQMLNLQAINGLSFKKGCYPGQEIVARMQYLGKLKRRLYLAHVQGATEVGAIIQAEDDGNERSVGTVVDAAALDADTTALLAVVEIAAAGQRLHLEGKSDKTLQIETLPYEEALETAK